MDKKFVTIDQVVIRQDGTCYGVFDGHYPYVRLAVGYGFGYFFKGEKGQDFGLLPKIQEGYLVVK
jgi:hypothetical protein